MKKSKQLMSFVPLVMTVALLAGCTSSQSVGVATPSTRQEPVVSTPVATTPPTQPALQATATTVIGTVTAPTAAPSLIEPAKASTLFTAIKKVVAANTFRAELDLKGKGFLGLSGDDTKPDPETLLFNLKGDFKGTEAHYVLKGFLTTLLGVDVDKGIEAMLTGDKAYVHGPVGLLGAGDDKWYVLESDQSEAITPPFLVNDFLVSLGNSNADLTTFKKVGAETLDSKKCDIFGSTVSEAKKVVSALTPGALPGVDDQSAISAADVKFSLCEDGYLHKVLMSVTSIGKEQADQKTDFVVTMHLYDFNAAITIAPPADASPLQIVDEPVEEDATPTP